jgi:predicted nucleotidyltransferase
LKDKKLPKWIKSKALKSFLNSKTGTVISYWIFQGMLYADYQEALFKLLLDVVLTALLTAVCTAPVYLSALAAHTLNMVFNGHLIAMRRHMGLGVNNPAKFIAYIEKFDARVRSKPYIRAVTAFGSLTRGSYRPTSDIDVRIVPLEDQISFFRACMFALAERTRAVLSGFPLDLYVFDIGSVQLKIRLDEIPMVFYDPHRLIEQTYQKVIGASQFIASFKVKYV